MMPKIHFRCPKCHGSQYRVSLLNITEKNPYGATCVFCKSVMIKNADYIFKAASPVLSLVKDRS
ncbi:hypothetical protein [Mangrovibacter phragmitis]|uniref:cold shock small protein YmcF n=1 Tax=Mangrovibacter phragmitis TaxID=1691903 RepID=UPI00336AAF28